MELLLEKPHDTALVGNGHIDEQFDMISYARSQNSVWKVILNETNLAKSQVYMPEDMQSHCCQGVVLSHSLF